jgi:hypothetical protein
MITCGEVDKGAMHPLHVHASSNKYSAADGRGVYARSLHCKRQHLPHKSSTVHLFSFCRRQEPGKLGQGRLDVLTTLTTETDLSEISQIAASERVLHQA